MLGVIRIQLQRAIPIFSLLLSNSWPWEGNLSSSSLQPPLSWAGARVLTPPSLWRVKSKSISHIYPDLTIACYKVVPRRYVEIWGWADSEGPPGGILSPEGQYYWLQPRHQVRDLSKLRRSNLLSRLRSSRGFMHLRISKVDEGENRWYKLGEFDKKFVSIVQMVHHYTINR